MSSPRPAALRHVLMAAALLLATVLPTGTASADVISGRPAPAAWDVSPATGQVVRAGSLSLAATGLSRAGIRSAQLRLDGVDLATSITSQSPLAARAVARASVTAGDHVAEAVFVDNDGHQFTRLWRFTATDRPWRRLAGDGRIDTAAAIARQSGGPRPAAVLALAADFPDALAGVPLAVAVDGPLLLTNRDELPAATADALRDLLDDGATVHVLGGTGSIGAGVVAAVEGLGFPTKRHAGTDRFGTAAEIAAALAASETAVVTSGYAFPDTLAVAAPAATQGWPILLSSPHELPAATVEALDGVTKVYLVGGPGTVSTDVEKHLRDLVGDVTRLAGDGRFDTAAAVVDALGPADATEVAVASGLTFPDALGGAVDAATRGVPLLLSSSLTLPMPTRRIVESLRPQGVTVYGGPNTLADAVPGAALAAGFDEGPVLQSMDPPPSGVVVSLDQIRLLFAADVSLTHTNLSVLFDGTEMHSRMAYGDFQNAVVVDLGPLPKTPVFGQDTPIRVVGTVYSGGVWRHVDHTVYFRKLAMSRGDSGAEVKAIQDRLVSMGYWIDKADGSYGTLTVQAVMAFQKVHGLPITGAVDPTTRDAINAADRPAPRSTSGTLFEVDKTRQVIFFVRNGQTEWVFNTSTGTEKPYKHEGKTYLADTPPGRWSFFREVDGERESELGILWRPKYFHSDGIAIHGSASVPAYPASHGCVRVTYQAMDFIWAQGLAPMGRSVWVYGTSPGS